MKADLHVHMVLDGVDWKAAIGRHRTAVDRDFVRRTLEVYRSQGYGYLRDGGDRWGVGAAARELAAGYGIVYRTPLGPLCLKGHYGSFIGTVYEDLKQYAQLVAGLRDRGGDFVKIMISGLMDFGQYGVLTEEGLPPEMIRELVHIAHEEGYSVMAHANGARTVEAAAMAGVDSVEHGAYLDRDALAAMVDCGTVWVPTLSTVANLRRTGRSPEDQVEKILGSAVENVQRFAGMGGLLGCGTDAGAWAVPHGTASEARLMEQILGPAAEQILDRGAQVIMERF